MFIKRQIHPIWIAIRYLVTIVGVIFVTYGLIIGADPVGYGADGSQSGPGFDWVLWGGLLLFLYWTAVVTHWIVDTYIWPTVQTAITPVPSPQEIELYLRRQGQDPTLSDIAAVHQMLSSERNTAAGGIAAAVAAAYVIRHA